MTAGQARPLLGLETPAEQIALARRIVEEDLSARRIEEILRREKTDKSGSLRIKRMRISARWKKIW